MSSKRMSFAIAGLVLFSVFHFGATAANTVSITSDQPNYVGNGEIISYLTIRKNGAVAPRAPENLTVRFYFPTSVPGASVTNLEEQIPDGSWQVVPQTASAMVPANLALAAYEARDSFTITLPAGTTEQFRATITFTKGSQGEFMVEAIGDQGGYGFLDPAFASYAVVARGGGYKV